MNEDIILGREENEHQQEQEQEQEEEWSKGKIQRA